MLSAFARAFRTPDLRRKLLFTIAIMAIFRVGSFIPTPGDDYPNEVSYRGCHSILGSRIVNRPNSGRNEQSQKT